MKKKRLTKKNIVWLSANIFGFKLLEDLGRLYPDSISSIITLDETSKVKMYDGVEAKSWKKFKIPIHKVVDATDLERVIGKLKPSLVIMCGWRQILSDKVLSLPLDGIIGFHPTLLPVGRGSAPIINSILSGMEKSGVTMFYVNAGTDTGDIIGQEGFLIEEDDTATEVYDKVIKAGSTLICKFIPFLIKGKAPRIPQDENRATQFTPRKVKDNEILKSDSLEMTYRKIRALARPYNGAFIKSGNKKLIIWKAELINEEDK